MNIYLNFFPSEKSLTLNVYNDNTFHPSDLDYTPWTVLVLQHLAAAIWMYLHKLLVVLLQGTLTNKHVPVLILGVMALSGSVVTLLLPETVHTKLPDTLLQAEHLQKVEHIDVELQLMQKDEECDETSKPV